MKDKYIPTILKNKIKNFTTYFLSFFYMALSILIFLSLYSFDINDNSFLTYSNTKTSNYLGNTGSYFASFIFYTFGIAGYGVSVFFFTRSLIILKGINANYIFIRILFFFISLILFPQIFIYHKINPEIWSNLNTWGILSKNLFAIHNNDLTSYILTILGIVIFIFSQKLFFFFTLPNFNLTRMNLKKQKINQKENNIKKEPIIRRVGNTDVIPENQSLAKKEIFNKRNSYESPSLEILESTDRNLVNKDKEKDLTELSKLLEKVFADFNISIEVINIKPGPVITLFEILPAAGIKISTIINLAGDVSRSMGVGAVRIAQIYGTQFLGVEIPNQKREAVTIRELLSNNNFKNSSHKIPICIGKDIAGNIEVIDLSKTPHLLVAGTTGSGKSVFINTLLTSLLYKFSPKDLRLILIDPKMLELSVYNDIAHLLTPVVTEPKKAILALKWVTKEMERRYSLMNEENTRSLEGFNEKVNEKLPYIVVFIDEMADLMMTAGKEVEHYVQRLAQMARACGIHLVMATQRPSVDIITGSIKANFPSRISFQVASKYDSRTILGEIGAEQLLGNGDMLMTKNGGNIIRYQSAFISDNEVNKIIREIKKTQKVEYLEELDEIIKNNNEDYHSLSDEDEELVSKSVDLIRNSGKASTSFLQRNFQIGYNKAARVMETLEERGVVSVPNHAGKRDILIN